MKQSIDLTRVALLGFAVPLVLMMGCGDSSSTTTTAITQAPPTTAAIVATTEAATVGETESPVAC